MEYVELPGGHVSLIAGRQAHQNLWPKVAAWLREHQPADTSDKTSGNGRG